MTGMGSRHPDHPEVEVSVLVPVTEVDGPLDELVGEVSDALASGGYAHELIFVVASLDDEGLQWLDTLVGGGRNVRTVVIGDRNPDSALREVALGEARSDVIVTLPSYPRITAEGVRTLVEALDDSVDMVTGARSTLGAPWGSRVRRRAFHFMLEHFVGGSFCDIGCGVRVMRREVLDKTRLFGDAYRFIPLFALRDGFRVREMVLPVHRGHTKTRFHGVGTYARRLIDLIGLMLLIRFTNSPLRFFGLIGGFIASVGAAILVVLFVQRLGGQGIADRPLLLLGVLLLVLGIQSLALGLVGEIVVHHGLTHHATYRVLDDSDRAAP